MVFHTFFTVSKISGIFEALLVACDPAAVRKAYAVIKEVVSEKTAADARCFLSELYVLCAEQALRLGCKEITEDCLMMYLESKPPTNQFLCRAYFCQAQLNSPRTVTCVEDLEKAVMYYLKAIEVSKGKPRYHFLVFNASLLYFQTIQVFLRPGRWQFLVPSLSQVLSALQEVQDPDLAWRAELMILYVDCLLDAGKKTEAASFSKVTSDFIELHAPELYPRIFSIQVRHDLMDVSNILTQANAKVLAIYKMQKLKHMTLSKAGDGSDKLKEIFLLLTQPSQAQSPASHSPGTDHSLSITLAERIELLLELAFLSLDLKEPRITENCLTELEPVSNTTVGQRIMMECVECLLALVKHKDLIEDYSKSTVQAWVDVVGRLETLLRRAVKDGDAQVIQCLCASLWNSCLPLLQHNLRRNIKSPLLTLAHALEESVLLDMRCQVHSELAAIEEEEERLESAIKHLRTALSLDETGQYKQRLSFSLHLLQLRCQFYSTPVRPEDQAAVLIQQVKEGCSYEPAKKWHPMLVSAGIVLAPDTFQMVLDADSSAGVSGSRIQDVEQLAKEAQHHRESVQEVEGHLSRLKNDTDDGERTRLWASLVKIARKLELWDVCRAACRFCLLYDDRRWKMKYDQKQKDEEGEDVKRELLRLLAEVHFINAEATIQKLRSEGVELNDSPLPSLKRSAHIPENDLHWTIYSDWIRELSIYATNNFMQGAEVGAELQESWLVANAAVYLWNYNCHILSTGGQHTLVPTFSRLVELLKQTGHAGEVMLLVLLCNTVAQGIIQPWCVSPGLTTQEETEPQPLTDKAKKGGGKLGFTPGLGLEAAAVQDIKKALQLCEYAMHLSSVNNDKLPIMVRKQIISTWVNIKQLLQQQIGQKLDIDEVCKNEAVAAMSRVLVGVEMLRCNCNPGLMEFTVPNLAVLVRMASECKWSDPVVALYVWSQLAHFAHQSSDHDLVEICTENAMKLEQTAVLKAKMTVYNLYSVKEVQEMLSSAACLRGLSMVHKSRGHLAKYTEALEILQSSISYAEQASSWSLCDTLARHYWNACLPLLETPEQRQQLQKPLELIVKALSRTSPQPATERYKGVKVQKETQVKSMTAMLETNSKVEDDLAVRAAMYSVLFQIHADNQNWRSGLQVLDQAIREVPRSPHRLILYKQRVLVKAQLGENIELDMQKFKECGELAFAQMWQCAALLAKDTQQQTVYYQNAILALQSADVQWYKVDMLLEFGEWLYFNHLPIAESQLHIQSAIDVLLSTDTDTRQNPSNAALASSLSALDGKTVSSVPILLELKDLRRLDALMRAHTLLALMESRVSALHHHYLILAYQFVLRIWQVSIETAQEIIKEAAKNSNPLPVPASSTKEDKEKEKGKKSKEPPHVEKKPRFISLPSTTEEWAQFECTEELRQAYHQDRSSQSVNNSHRMQSRTLFYLDILVKALESVSQTPLTLPLLHLSELIAHDRSLSKSHSDLYRLRIIKTCCELRLESSTPYRETLLSFATIPEEEQMLCRKAIALQRERSGHRTESEIRKTHEMFPAHSWGAAVSGSVYRKKLDRHAVQDLWLDKAAVCLSMGLYQPARRLLVEAQLVSKELEDQTALAKTFYQLAILASHNQQQDQAHALLKQAQEIGGDEDFWYNLTLILLNVTAELHGEDTYAQVCQITDTATGFFRSVLQQRRNQASVLNFYISSLRTRGAVLCRIALSPACPGQAVDTKTVKRLHSLCDTLKHSAAVLLDHGYKTPAAETTYEQANTLRMLAMLTSVKEEKQRYLLDALLLLQKTVSIQEDVLSNCLKLLPLHECEWSKLPAMRESVRFRLALADLGLLLLDMHCEEEMVQARFRSMKNPTERAVEDYIKSSADLSDLENEWLSIGQSVGQVTLTQLTVVQSLLKDCVKTRVLSLSMLGKCLRLLAQRKDPLYPSTLWDRPIMKNTVEKQGETEDEDEQSKRGVEESTTQKSANTCESAEPESNRTAVQQMLTQARETLTEALNLGLQNNLPELLAQICGELLECHSQYDPTSSGQYLALLQSCVCCTEMSRVLHAACLDTGKSQVAALLGLQKSLQLSDQHSSSVLSAVNHSLHSLSKAYQQLNINPNHLGFLEEMPPNLKILLLQHSGDGSLLYGALYEKVKATENQKGRSMQAPGGLVCTSVAKARVQPSVMHRLRKQAQTFKSLAARTLRNKSHQHKSTAGTEQHSQLEHDTDQELGTHLQAVVQQMEDYLHPILSQFDFSSFSQCPSLTGNDENTQPKDKENREATDKTQSGSSEEQKECVVVLADRILLDLPLECLAVLKGDGISSVSRDFSLQVFYTRLQRDQSVESDNKKDIKSGKAAKGKGDQSKGIKVAPMDRTVPAHCLPVDTHKFKYFVESHNDVEDTKCIDPSETVRKSIEMYPQSTALWKGIMGTDLSYSAEDLEHLLTNCSSFIFFGSRRFVSHISPARLATLDLSECQMAILFDLHQSATNIRRQSQRDVHMSKDMLALKAPVECVYLLTLSGVHSVMLNQWSSSGTVNAYNMDVILENLLKTGLTSGQAVYTLRARSTQISEKTDCAAGEGAAPSWSSLLAFNFIIYGLPNLVVI
ncbi:cilia- and flagella-associated protein 46 [Trichomycterus rosablanca]|uniref:cilia- and flagella-associated protein 46 n=1 Tax=Trichomycterus rosablanca TaxID=2290929 RepID=UPI002F356FDF